MTGGGGANAFTENPKANIYNFKLFNDLIQIKFILLTPVANKKDY